ncbi:MAG: 50S ribosomal protein L31 [Patescibacteria group bacterium]
MKKDIHPQYHNEAKIKCACGHVFVVGSTKPEIKVEICGACHPFYTGKEKLIDTAGRVEKFKARMTKKKKSPEKKTRVKNKKPAADL